MKIVTMISANMQTVQTRDIPMNQNVIVKENNNQARNLLGGRIVIINFDNHIRLVMRMDTPFRTREFVIGSYPEKELVPETESKFEIFRLLTFHMRQVYALYEATSDFPAGLLIVRVNGLTVLL